jgi:hypothetical protein
VKCPRAPETLACRLTPNVTCSSLAIHTIRVNFAPRQHVLVAFPWREDGLIRRARPASPFRTPAGWFATASLVQNAKCASNFAHDFEEKLGEGLFFARYNSETAMITPFISMD